MTTHFAWATTRLQIFATDPFAVSVCRSLADLICGNRTTSHRHSEKIFAQVSSSGRRQDHVSAYSGGI